MFKEIIVKQLEKIAQEAKGWSVSFAPEGFGDYTTNLAMILAKEQKASPLKLGENLVEQLKKNKDLKKWFREISLVKPGFINFYLGPEARRAELSKVLKEKENYGFTNLGQGRKVNLEFVSANPTGLLTLGNGRSAAYGESLARLWNFMGYQVTKEYYLNDVGRQVHILGESVARRYLELSGKTTDYPEEMYQGEYVAELAKDLKKEGLFHGSLDDFDSLAITAQAYAVEKMTQSIKESLLKFGVRHDLWFKESDLEKNGEIKEALNYLEFSQLSYEKDGALWFKATNFGLDQDVVVRKSNGFTTYLLSDFAYARNKSKRGFDKMFFIFGADHHGDVARIKAGLRALELDESKFHFLLYQLVTLKEKGEIVRMSKRAGRFITLDALLEEISPDVAKFFFLAKSMDSHVEFDLDLARETSNKNPVYYLQYAYVRLLSVERKAKEQKISWSTRVEKNYAWSKEEEDIIRQLGRWPETLEKISENGQIHHLASYALGLAGLVNRWYELYPILEAKDKTRKTRLTLVRASVMVLRNALVILGLSLPEKM